MDCLIQEIVSQVADDLWKRIELCPTGYPTTEWEKRYPEF